MATDPKKDKTKDFELSDERLEDVAGGDKGEPTDTVFPPARKDNLDASEAP